MCLLFFVSSSIIQCNVCVFVFICVARWNVQTSCFDRAYVVRLCMCITVPKQIEIPNSRTLVNMCVRMRVFVCVIFVFYSHREHLPHDFRICTPRRPEKKYAIPRHTRSTAWRPVAHYYFRARSRARHSFRTTNVRNDRGTRTRVFALHPVPIASTRVCGQQNRSKLTLTHRHTHTRTNSICIIAERPGPVCLGAIIIIM